MRDNAPQLPKHLQEHEKPTVIHHGEDTLLAQWLMRAMAKGPMFWALVAGVVVVVIGLAVLAGGLTAGRSASADAWMEVLLAKTPEDQIKAAATPGPAAGWALLQAAEARYQEAFTDLPANREAALPLLNKSKDLFEQAYEKATDPTVKRLAAIGEARALEARGDLDDAIKQYERVIKEWPKSDEATQAERLVRELQKPENRTFYQNFSTFKPSEFTLPPRGQSILDRLPAGHPALDGPMVPAPGLPTLPGSSAPSSVPPADPTPVEPKAEAKPAVELPATPFAPEPEDKPKAKAGELPNSPFSGGEPNKGEAPKR